MLRDDITIWYRHSSLLYESVKKTHLLLHLDQVNVLSVVKEVYL